MAHFNIIEEEEVRKEKLLEEMYQITDEYNDFVKYMDKKLDTVLSKMESLYEN